MRKTKLIVLRGPSSSGKSSTAKILFEKAVHRTVLIQQDHYRFIFKPAGGGSKPNSEAIRKMIKHNVKTSLKHGYDVILEGILTVKSYSKILDDIFKSHSGENYLFYFDISLKETIRRHITDSERVNSFSAEDMESWYAGSHRSHHELEQLIPEHYSQEDIVDHILKTSNLLSA